MRYMKPFWRKNKKAYAYNTLLYIVFRLPFIVVFFYALFAFASTYINADLDTIDLRAGILSERFVNTISVAENYRTYPGIVTLDKLKNEEVLIGHADNDQFSAALKLEDLDTNTSYETYLNKKWFERYYTLSKFQAYHGTHIWKYVLVGQEKHNGRLFIRMVEHE